MNTSLSSYRFVAASAVGLCLMGCSLLKPSGSTPRSFVLQPIPPAPASDRITTNMVIGIKPVKMPGYLSSKSIAMRRGGNEIVYMETSEWAEPLDTALQRVLAANLGALVPTEQVRLSNWGAEAVAVEADVTVERFDVDSSGEGVLMAWWRVLSPGGQKVIASGKFSATRKGPPPNADPQGAAASMSSLAADLAQKLVQVIKRPEG